MLYHAVHNFCSVELSSIYLDILKDRVYTAAPNSVARRSAQTAMYRILDALTRLIAPVLSFTADEIWAQMPGEREASVHLAGFPRFETSLLDSGLMIFISNCGPCDPKCPKHWSWHVMPS